MAVALTVCGVLPMMAQADEGTPSASFPLQFFQQVAKEHPSDNVLVSPFSVSTALSMTYSGAAGDTKRVMANVLGVPLSKLGLVEEVAAKSKIVSDSLRKAGTNTQLEIANALFGEKSIKFKPDFLSMNKQYFDAEITALDFKAPDSLKVINGWVSEKTHGKIPTIIEQIGDDAILYLINAIYFKGTWANKFEKSATKPADFTLLDGTTKKVSMMHMSRDDFRYFESKDVQIINLPYSDGRLSMYVVLPAKGTKISAFEAGLTKEKWDEYMMSTFKRDGKLGLPRFKIEDKMTLKDVLCKMGMEVAFDQGKADFSEMADVQQRIYISQVFHKTFMEVNEEGTEAAAATAVEMSIASAMMNPPPPFEMIVDRPFLLALRDNQTDSTLFMGRVANPPDAQ
jgi:serpin B